MVARGEIRGPDAPAPHRLADHNRGRVITSHHQPRPTPTGIPEPAEPERRYGREKRSGSFTLISKSSGPSSVSVTRISGDLSGANKTHGAGWDFGDSTAHEVHFESIHPRVRRGKSGLFASRRMY
jgi:hypothetical protein